MFYTVNVTGDEVPGDKDGKTTILTNCVYTPVYEVRYATLVAGYSAWQKQFGRQVQKGEKAIHSGILIVVSYSTCRTCNRIIATKHLCSWKVVTSLKLQYIANNALLPRALVGIVDKELLIDRLNSGR